MDPDSVINLGHKAEQPLIWPRSELLDGLEPHDHFYATRHGMRHTSYQEWHGRVYPGWWQWVGTGGYYTGYTQPSKIEAYLRYIKNNRFIRPFDWVS